MPDIGCVDVELYGISPVLYNVFVSFYSEDTHLVKQNTQNFWALLNILDLSSYLQTIEIIH